MTDQIISGIGNADAGSRVLEDVKEAAKRVATALERADQVKYIENATARARTTDQAQEALNYANNALKYQKSKKG